MAEAAWKRSQTSLGSNVIIVAYMYDCIVLPYVLNSIPLRLSSLIVIHIDIDLVTTGSDERVMRIQIHSTCPSALIIVLGLLFPVTTV